MKRVWAICLLWLLLAGAGAAWAAEPPVVDAAGWVLLEAGSGRVVAGGNIHQRLPMASTTKIMSALLVLEQPALDEYFTVDAAAIQVEGSSMGLQPGDQATLRVLAAGMLLASGNDAAGAAAVRVAGSVEAFVAQMNRRARGMGLTDTSFATPSGLDGEDHYSSAYDMAMLAREALANEAFAAICGAEKMKLSYGAPPYDRWLSNHNRLLQRYNGTVGVKTGFTKKSGRCLVSAATREDVTLIGVTLNAPDDWNQHEALFNYGFSILRPVALAALAGPIWLPVVGGPTPQVRAELRGAPVVALTDEECGRVQTQLFLQPFYYAPLAADQIVGEAVFLLDDKKLVSVPICPVCTVAVPETAPVKPKAGLAGFFEWIGTLFRKEKT